MRTILVGYDGSISASGRLDFAVELASRFSAELRLLAVVRPPDFAEDVETEDWVERSQRHLRNILQPAKVKVAAAGLPCVADVVVGHPAEQIVRYAESHGVDHIVVGHRGHTRFERFLIGSVARQVIAYADCAVTVVRTARTPVR